MSGSSLFYKGKKVAYCPYVVNWGKKIKRTVNKKNGKAGDIVLFNFSGGSSAQHIGLIYKRNSNGTYTTIEGNTGSTNNANGGQVQKRIRYRSQIVCIIRPKYTKEYTAKSLLKTAKSQVGVKESPRNSNKTKYGKEYGLNGQPWCCIFVWWCFKHMKKTTATTNIASVKTTTKTTTTDVSKFPTLKVGDKNKKYVTKLRTQLKKKKYGHIKVLKFTKYTKALCKLVKQFQKKNGLTADGVVGQKTWKKLYK